MLQQIRIDKEIIDKCRSGSLHEFRKVVELTSPFAFSVAQRMLGDEEEAKDITQDTMITIWKSMKKIKSSESFMPWLYRIVVNKCYDQLRRRKKNPEINADDHFWEQISNKISANPSADLENEETAKIIALLTEKLSPRQKTVFVLSDLEEMSNEEISAITGMSRINIKSNLHYARKKMCEMIERYI